MLNLLAKAAAIAVGVTLGVIVGSALAILVVGYVARELVEITIR